MEIVIEYLEKTKNGFHDQRNTLEQQKKDLEIQLKENTRFIQLLQETDDFTFEAFSPRSINAYQKTKIKELQTEKKELMKSIETVKESIGILTEKILEIDQVLRSSIEAKRKLDSMR